jgi:hypothetical protein
MSNLSVRYVGQKTQRADTVAGTGLTWYGHGDIQSVPLAAWDKLKRHPDVWELVDTTTEAPKTEGTLGAASAPAPDAEGKSEGQSADEQPAAASSTVPNWMTVEDPAELRKIAKAMGVAVHHKVNDVAKIREAIAAAQKVEA